MKENEFNPIGIDSQLDWPRIRKLFRIGLFASVLHLIADMLLGWGVQDTSLSGIERMFSAYGELGNSAIYAAATIGMLGIILEGLSYFGVYRLMAAQSPKHAHRYRSGILGYLMFYPFGFHVIVCIIVYLGRNGAASLVDNLERYFFLPGYALFWIFFIVLTITQISAFAKGKTPYPKWCWVFSILVGMAATKLINVFGNRPLVNAVDCAWMAVGNLWMFAGLLVMMKKIPKNKETGK